MLTHLNFEKLKIFHIVYLNKSILKASQILNVTRSAVSQSLKSLEEELKFSLFIRDSKKFQPTSEADQLFQAINPFVNQLHTTLESLESGRKNPTGLLRIGAPMDLGSDHLTKIIGHFRKKYPEVTFEITLAIPIKQLDLLCAGKLDIAFIDNGDVHAAKYDVSFQSVMKEEFVMVASDKMIKAYKIGSRSGFQDLAKIPLVDYVSHGPVARMWFNHHFNKIPSKLNLVFSAESVRAVLNAISADIGIGVIPQRILSEGGSKHLHVIETVKKPFINQIMIARQVGRPKSFRETEFINFFREHTR